MSNDYYRDLRVSRGASSDEIRKAYKKLARKYQPDANPDDDLAAQKFKEIQEAYSVLNDPDQRQKYDQFGQAFKQAGRGGGGPPFNWGGGGEVDLNVILGGLFGGGAQPGGFGGGFGQRSPRPAKGQDLQTEIQIPFTLAAEGGHYDLSLTRDGRSERLDVQVPSGVRQGSVIRLSGQGHPGLHGGPNGDLLITIHVAVHPYFRRELNHLVIDLPLTPSEAALGTRVDVPTLSEGMVVLTVPPGTSTGARLRLRSKGILDQKTRVRGDQFVQVRVKVPREMNAEVEEAYRNLAERSDFNPRAGIWS